MDENGRATIIAASSNDGVTIVPAVANPSNHGLRINDASTGSDNGNNEDNAMLDENSVAVWTALDSNGNLVEIYGNPATNAILIDSN